MVSDAEIFTQGTSLNKVFTKSISAHFVQSIKHEKWNTQPLLEQSSIYTELTMQVLVLKILIIVPNIMFMLL